MKTTPPGGAPASFPASYPLSLAVSNNGLPVLYLDFMASQTLQFQVKNVSQSNFAFPPPQVATSTNDYRMIISLQPGVLDNTRLDALSLVEKDWELVAQASPDGGTNLCFINTDSIALSKASSIALTLNNARVAANAIPSMTRVGLAFDLYNDDSQQPVSGSRTAYLQVVPGSHNTMATPPIWFGCSGASTVINDNKTVNSLSLLIANRAAAIPLVLSRASDARPTTFTLSFDVQGEGETRPWALGTTSQIQGITVVSNSPEWTVEHDSQSAVPMWTIKSDTHSLAAGASLSLSVGGIVSGLANGETNVYLSFSNLPGYGDGQLIATLDKGPLTLGAAAVGIGAPVRGSDYPLQVAGSVQANDFVLANGAAVIPVGTIVMWGGKEIPEGWQLCDGTHNTPNLSSHFIVAAGPNPEHGQPVYNPGQSGNYDVHQHDGRTAPQHHVGGTSNPGDHKHQVASSNNFREGQSGTTPGSYGSYVPNVWDTARPFESEPEGGHTHDLDIPELTFTTSDDQKPDYYNRPAWFALAFIMKV